MPAQSHVPAHDLVVFGATSFVGQILTRYLAEEFGTHGRLRWAIAGRSAQKLETLRGSLGLKAAKLPLVVADAGALQAQFRAGMYSTFGRYNVAPARCAKGGVFHPKLMLLRAGKHYLAGIGSANLTPGGLGGNLAWVWKSFTRGYNPIFMDPYDGAVLGNRFDPQWEPIRRNLGHALRLASRLNLAAMTPQDDLASTKYCLADPGKAYVVYIPSGGKVKVALGQAKNRFAVEWIHPSTGKAVAGDAVTLTLKGTFSPDGKVAQIQASDTIKVLQ